jgi:hypothetical protein
MPKSSTSKVYETTFHLSFLQATKFLDPNSLFQREIDETREQVAHCIKTLVSFR